MVENFYKINIENKLSLLQSEHREIMSYLYKDALKNNSIKGYMLNPDIQQCKNINDIFRELKMDEKVILTCLHDLESIGFVYNTNANLAMTCLDAYALSTLGLKYIEYNDNELKDK